MWSVARLVFARNTKSFAEQDAVISKFVRDAAWSYKALIAAFSAIAAAVGGLLVWAHFTVATGDISLIVHAEYLLAYTKSPTPLLWTYAVVASLVLGTAFNGIKIYNDLQPVHVRGDIDSPPWRRRLFPTRIAQRRFLGVTLPVAAAPIARFIIPQHAQWALAAAILYLPIAAYWASVLLHHELFIIHVWWLVVGAPGICVAFVLVVLSGDSMLQDAVNLGKYKYSLKSA